MVTPLSTCTNKRNEIMFKKQRCRDGLSMTFCFSLGIFLFPLFHAVTSLATFPLILEKLFPFVQPIFNPRRACAARVTVLGSIRVCVCVCLSVKSHLTYGASVRPENAIAY